MKFRYKFQSQDRKKKQELKHTGLLSGNNSYKQIVPVPSSILEDDFKKTWTFVIVQYETCLS